MFSWAHFAPFFAHILPYDFIVKELTRISREEKLGTSVVVPEEAGSRPRRNFAVITDGTSNTLAIVEVKEPFNWMDPTADIDMEELMKGINAPDGRVGSFHPGGVNVGLLDGVVRFVPETVSPQLLRALGSPRSGESVSLP